MDLVVRVPQNVKAGIVSTIFVLFRQVAWAIVAGMGILVKVDIAMKEVGFVQMA